MLAPPVKIKNISYYLGIAKEDYYINGGEPPGYWFGGGAGFFGLSGKVLKEILKVFFGGFRPPADPDGGFGATPLVQNAGDKKRVNGWDLCFSLPKSASLMWAYASPEFARRIEAIEKAAIEETLTYIEREFGWSRMGKGGTEYVRAKLLFANFPHSTNRNMEPGYHTHSLLINIAACPDGKTRAVYATPILENQHLIGAVFRNAFARRCRKELGVELENDRGQFFRIKHIPKKAEIDNSTRRQEVLAEQERVGVKGGSSERIAVRKTAKWKDIIPPRNELRKGWQEQGVSRYGLTQEKIDGFAGKDKAPKFSRKVRDRALKEALDRTFQAHQSMFKEHDFHRWLFALLSTEAYEIHELIRFADDFLHLHPDLVHLTTRFGQRFYSTFEILEEEKKLLDTASRLRHRNTFPKVTKEIQECIIAQEQLRLARLGIILDEQQLRAIRKITSNHRNLEFLNGVAGAGKTSVLEVIAKIFREAGYNVIGMAPTNQASNQLLIENDKTETYTIAKGLGDWRFPLRWKLLHHVDMILRSAQVYYKKRPWYARKKRRGMFARIGRPATYKLQKPRPLKIEKNTVIITDELSMLGTRQYLDLLSYAELNEAKLVGTGDNNQIQSIDRGGPQNSLLKRYEAHELTKARRQRHAWGRKMVEEFKAGHVVEALKTLRDNGEVYGAETVPLLIEKAVSQWERWGIASPEDTVVLCFENYQVHQVNQLCQARRLEMGHLSGKPFRVKYSTSNKEKFSENVFVGDRIVFQSTNQKKGYDKNGSGILRARNGRFATVEVLGKEGADGKPLLAEIEFRSGHPSQFSLGYAGTNFKAQAVSIEHVICILNGVMLDRENAYVALSRFRDNLVMLALDQDLESFWKDIEDSPITKAISRSNLKGLACDLIPKPTPDEKPENSDMEGWGRYFQRMMLEADDRRRQRGESDFVYADIDYSLLHSQLGIEEEIQAANQEAEIGDIGGECYLNDSNYQAPDFEEMFAELEEIENDLETIQEFSQQEYEIAPNILAGDYCQQQSETFGQGVYAEEWERYVQERRIEQQKHKQLAKEIAEDELAAIIRDKLKQASPVSPVRSSQRKRTLVELAEELRKDTSGKNLSKSKKLEKFRETLEAIHKSKTQEIQRKARREYPSYLEREKQTGVRRKEELEYRMAQYKSVLRSVEHEFLHGSKGAELSNTQVIMETLKLPKNRVVSCPSPITGVELYRTSYCDLMEQMKHSLLLEEFNEDTESNITEFFIPMLEAVVCQILDETLPGFLTPPGERRETLRLPTYSQIHHTLTSVVQLQALSLAQEENVLRREKDAEGTIERKYHVPDALREASKVRKDDWTLENNAVNNQYGYPLIYNSPISKEQFPELYSNSLLRRIVSKERRNTRTTTKKIREERIQKGLMIEITIWYRITTRWEEHTKYMKGK